MKKNTLLKFLALAIVLLCIVFAVIYMRSPGQNVVLENVDLSKTTGCVNLTSDMNLGSDDKSTNNDVSRLQSYLFKTGYLQSTSTGEFDQATLLAVQKFQTDKELKALGYVGKLTRSKIQEVTCGDTAPQASSTTPYVWTVTPNPAHVGDLITVEGFGFTKNIGLAGKEYASGSAIPTNIILFSGVSITDVAINGDSTLFFTIPQNTKPGKYTVAVKNPNGTSNSFSITVTSN